MLMILSDAWADALKLLYPVILFWGSAFAQTYPTMRRPESPILQPSVSKGYICDLVWY